MFDKESFDVAGDLAAKELAELVKAHPEMTDTLIVLQAWVKKNYMGAGLKRLARVIKDGGWK